jgi:glycosyltransferase involved in cell wall biosynthesis
MRIAILAEGGYPYASGEGSAWCDRLVRGLPRHEFEVYALTRAAAHEAVAQPPNVTRVRSLPLYGPPPVLGASRRRGLVLAQYRDLAGVLASGGGDLPDRFATALYGLAELARDDGGVPAFLRSEQALGALEDACTGSGGGMNVSDLLTAADLLERALRPMSAPWYHPDGDGLATADVCHAVSGGAAVLPGLLAKRFFGTPLLVTEYGVRLRETLLAQRAAGLSPPVRTLLTAFHRLLAREAYRQAALVTPGNAHARRWQEQGGADRARIRVVYPGMDGAQLVPSAGPGDGRTLVWVGRAAPAKDLVGLLHAFEEVRKADPEARLRIVGTSAEAGEAGEAGGYQAHCRALAERLFPGGCGSPVSFETVGSPEVPGLGEAYGAGDVLVLPSIVEGFPVALVEAMLCGRATVSTDVGAVREVIGGTGLVVPPRNPEALAAACLALLRDPERRARLGAAARERALELFTVEQNIAAFRDIYLGLAADPADLAEFRVPGRWAADHPGHRRPAWAHESTCVGASRQEEPA